MNSYEEEKIYQFTKWIYESKQIVFFGGAGVSTESGIPDFRSVDGLYNQLYKFSPETILSHSFFTNNQKEFYSFYWDKMICEKAEPNITHKMLAMLERQGRLSAIVTQNIDGLHQQAGSKNVLELHGSVHRNYCMKCGSFFNLEGIKSSVNIEEKNNMGDGIVPYCECGGVIKPDVVLYEEPLNEKIMKKAMYYISTADMFIVGGTSLSVYPAASFVRYYNGNKLVIINKSTTAYDNNADLLFQCGLGEVFACLEKN